MAASAIVVVLVVAFALERSSDDADPDASRSLTDAELVACSNGIGSGVIADVSVVEATSEVRLTVTVEEWLKPSSGSGESIRFMTMSADETGDPPFQRGNRILFVLQQAVDNNLVFRELTDPADPTSAQAMEREVRAVLERKESVTCPSFWGR